MGELGVYVIRITYVVLVVGGVDDTGSAVPDFGEGTWSVRFAYVGDARLVAPPVVVIRVGDVSVYAVGLCCGSSGKTHA